MPLVWVGVYVAGDDAVWDGCEVVKAVSDVFWFLDVVGGGSVSGGNAYVSEVKLLLGAQV